MITIPTSTASLALSNISGLFADLSPITVLIGGIVGGFFVIEILIDIVSFRVSARREAAAAAERPAQEAIALHKQFEKTMSGSDEKNIS